MDIELYRDISVVPSLEQRLEFISNLYLPKRKSVMGLTHFSRHAGSVDTEEGAASAMLINDTLFNCMEGLNRAERSAVKNSIKIAMLVANTYQHEDFSLAGWLEIYAKTLNHFGWYSDKHPGEKIYRDLSANVSTKIIETVRALSNEPLLANSLAAFKALELNQSGLRAYAQATFHGKSFQVMPAGYDQSGRVTLLLNHARLKTRREENRFLFFSWQSGEAELYHNFRSFFSTGPPTLKLGKSLRNYSKRVTLQK